VLSSILHSDDSLVLLLGIAAPSGRASEMKTEDPMNTALKFVVANLLVLQLTAISFQTATAQTVEATPTDSLCDYCKDYTDAAAATGNIRSAYRPISSYPAEREAATETAVE
jgi:hypothetical protein